MVQSEDRMRKPLLIQKQKRICKEYQDYEKDSMFIKLEQEKKDFNINKITLWQSLVVAWLNKDEIKNNQCTACI
jgi:hypothetical protein